MDTIGAFDAKTHFSQLLERVAAGETITITRHGTPVAKLVPVNAEADRKKRADAVERMKEFGRRHALGKIDIKALIEEGRM